MDFTLDSATPMVSASFDEAPNARTREIMQALTRHLHAFILDVKPTLAEWNTGIDFLTEVGHWCTDVRQEFVMFSDVMGVSMLVETLNGEDGGTESTVLGPFHMTESPVRELGDNIDMMGGAHPCVVSGRIIDVNGTPVPNAELDIWQCTDEGFYDVQQPDVQPAGNGRGLFRTDAEGRFWFRTVAPSHYPVPTDGPVGRMLGATNRHPYRPAHIHFITSARGFRDVTSQVFVADSPYIDSDTVFAVKDSLVVPFRESDEGEAAERFGVETPFLHGHFEVVLSEDKSEQIDPAMTATLIDGTAIARRVRADVAAQVAALDRNGGQVPCLATVLVGDDPASAGYVRSKLGACAEAGMRNVHHPLPADVSQSQVATLLQNLAKDPAISGILLQLPVPPHLDVDGLLALIPVDKDVDGLTTASAGRLASGRPGLHPCTPAGVLRLLDELEITLSGAHAVVVGRSNLVGRPMAQMLINRNATVTLCHSHTKDLDSICRQADVLIVAAGVPHLIGRDAVRSGAAVIDVGIHRGERGLHGDVLFDEVAEVAGVITPVPGGVGPMTIAMLVANTLFAAQSQQGMALPPR